MPDSTSRRPFHETIVEAIRSCTNPGSGQILVLFDLINNTVIPDGYDAIISAIDNYFDFPGANKWARDIRLVKESLEEQRQKHRVVPDNQRHLGALYDEAILLQNEVVRKNLRLSVLHELISASENINTKLGLQIRVKAIECALAAGDGKRATELFNLFVTRDKPNPADHMTLQKLL